MQRGPCRLGHAHREAPGTTLPLNIFKIYGRFTSAVACLCL
nr:MAG TPA: hypothetical protein [Caudoviricetes sp.]